VWQLAHEMVIDVRLPRHGEKVRWSRRPPVVRHTLKNAGSCSQSVLHCTPSSEQIPSIEQQQQLLKRHGVPQSWLSGK